MKPLVVLLVLVVLVGVAVAVPTSCGEAVGVRAIEQTVTRDFGAEVIARERSADVPDDQTVLGLLQEEMAVELGPDGSVSAIEGFRARTRDGDPVAWSYFVNGVRGTQPAAERTLSPGDRVWWDLNPGLAGGRPSAVVGSFPEPFLSGFEGRRRPVRVDCAAGAEELCDEVTARLSRAGVTAVARSSIEGPGGPELLRVVVGPWSELRLDPTLRQLENEPSESGVLARFRAEGRRLDLYDTEGSVARTLGAGTGLIAATRFEGQQPTWVVTGTDEVGAAAAAGALEERFLAQRFSVAIVEGLPVGVPLAAEPR